MDKKLTIEESRKIFEKICAEYGVGFDKDLTQRLQKLLVQGKIDEDMLVGVAQKKRSMQREQMLENAPPHNPHQWH